MRKASAFLYGVAAAAALMTATSPFLRPERPAIYRPARPLPKGKGKKRRKGPRPNERSHQLFDLSRVSRAHGSSVKKLKRFYRAHPDRVVLPTETAKLRHAWYRQHKAFEALRAAHNS